MRSPEHQAYLDYHNQELMRHWGVTTPDAARLRLEAVKQFAMSEFGFSREHVDSVEDHRVVLGFERAMKEAEARDELRRYARGEILPPAPAPTFRQTLDTIKADSDRADFVGKALPNWGETTDHTNRDRVIEMLERKQGIR